MIIKVNKKDIMLEAGDFDGENGDGSSGSSVRKNIEIEPSDKVRDKKGDKDDKDTGDGDTEGGGGGDTGDGDTEGGGGGDTGDGDTEGKKGKEESKKSKSTLKKQLDDLKEKLKGSTLGNLLKNKSDDKTVFGSDENEEIFNKAREDLGLDKLEKVDDEGKGGKGGKGKGDKDTEKEDSDIEHDEDLEDIYADEELNNLIDSDEEIVNAIKETESSKKGIQKAGTVGLSDIMIRDKSKFIYNKLILYINKWIKRLIGKLDDEKTVYRLDLPSRKVPGLWGREIEDEPPEVETKDKVLLFVFDTSGSMDTRLVGNVCSEISYKLVKNRAIGKVAMINFEGIWSSQKIFEPLMGFKNRLKKFLRLGTGSDMKPVWVSVGRLLKVKKNIKIHGIVIISDFEIVNIHIPKELKTISFLLLGLGSTRDNILNFIRNNPGVNFYSVNLTDKKIEEITPLKVSKI